MNYAVAILVWMLVSWAAFAADSRGLSQVRPPPPELKLPEF
jgi:hypothetical protein